MQSTVPGTFLAGAGRAPVGMAVLAPGRTSGIGPVAAAGGRK